MIIEELEEIVKKEVYQDQKLLRDILYAHHIMSPDGKYYKSAWFIDILMGRSELDTKKFRICGVSFQEGQKSDLLMFHKLALDRVKASKRFTLEEWYSQQNDKVSTTDLILGDKSFDRNEEIVRLVVAGKNNQVWYEPTKETRFSDKYFFRIEYYLKDTLKKHFEMFFPAWDADNKLWVVSHWNDDIDALHKAVKDFVIKYDITVHADLMEQWYGNKDSIRASLTEGENYDIPFMKMQPYLYQKGGIKYGREKKRVLIADEMGLGKQNVNGTPVLTPNGWVPIESLKVGDPIFRKNGCVGKVTGVFPQGIQPIYKVTFSDDTSTEVGLEHLWSVRSENDRKRGKPWRTVNTEFIKNNLKYVNGASIWQIPLCDPIRYPEKKLLIDPYLMGVLIADGVLEKGVCFVPGDKEVPHIVKGRIPFGYTLNELADYDTSTAYSITTAPNNAPNPMWDYIRNVGLSVTGEYKFIPKEYLTASFLQRRDLLSGLLDSDGTVKGARTRYSTGSKKLALDIVTLVQSLGGIATVSLVPGRLRIRNGKKSQEADNYQINVRVPFNPFTKESNHIKWKVSNKLIRNIVSVEYTRDEHATCISVDAEDKLYIVNDHIVTHNTVQSIGILAMDDYEGKEVFPCLVVCPKSLVYNWQNEWNKFTNIKSSVYGEYSKHADVIIVSYNNAKKFLKAKDTFKSIIVDESHFIKSETSQRYAIIRELCENKEYRLFLTGTPIVNNPRELMPQLTALGYLKAETKAKFISRYCGKKNEGKNLDELNIKLRSLCMIRRMKADVQKELPAKIRQTIDCDITNMADYKMAETDFINFLKEKLKYSDGRINKAIQGEALMKVQLLKKLAAKGKIASVIDFIQNMIDSEEKVIVFAHHSDIIQELQTAFDTKLVITGATEARARQTIVDKFQNDPSEKVIVLSIRAASVGLTLTAASNVCFAELDWTAAQHDQAEDRAHRIGQQDTVNAYYFLGKKTIDAHIFNIIESKRQLSNEATGSESNVQTNASAFAELMKNAFGVDAFIGLPDEPLEETPKETETEEFDFTENP